MDIQFIVSLYNEIPFCRNISVYSKVTFNTKITYFVKGARCIMKYKQMKYSLSYQLRGLLNINCHLALFIKPEWQKIYSTTRNCYKIFYCKLFFGILEFFCFPIFIIWKAGYHKNENCFFSILVRNF